MPDDGSIRTFLRIRPSRHPSGLFVQDEEESSRLKFEIPVELKAGVLVNNTQSRHDFKFSDILGPLATQEEVFNMIGKDAVMNVLDGYNSTIFAYGQTGSGKTFTVTGGAERYVDRGIIPRGLSLLFAEFKKRSDTQYTCHVSYLELYNEQGYDLLDPSHETKNLEDLPRVSLMEDESGSIHLKNLSMYMSATEEEALNYLFLGDTNRAISETAMNKASSRSHCIFTVSIEGRKAGGDKVTRSKLHLVDLAGSERVHKTNATGQTLQEAKYINTSLFYLEMVIVALHDKAAKGRRHVPYRNSMMTSVLRDSLGGNCKTVMIATINPEAAHTEESISTCRFAQRVSLIKNAAVVNEDLDPALMIRRLKGEVAALRDEVSYLKGEAGEGAPLTAEERANLEHACAVYVNASDPQVSLSIGAYTLTKIRDAFAVLKSMVLEARHSSSTGRSDGVSSSSSGSESSNTILSLKMALQERDAEIAILVNMVKQGTGMPTTAVAAAVAPSHGTVQQQQQQQHSSGSDGDWQKAKLAAAAASRKQQQQQQKEAAIPRPEDPGVLQDPQSALQYFRGYYPHNAAIEENKSILQQKYTKAKAMGARVNQARSTITYLKSTIEQIRRERAMEGLIDDHSSSKEADENDDDRSTGTSSAAAAAADADEAKYKQAIEEEKRVYKDSFQELRELKAEIENIQKLLEKARVRMQADFEAWYEPLVSELEEHAATAGPTPPPSVHSSSGRTAVSAYSQPKSAVSSQSTHDAWADAKDTSSYTGTSNGRRVTPQLSGEKEVDDDILAFYKAKEELQQRRNSMPALQQRS